MKKGGYNMNFEDLDNKYKKLKVLGYDTYMHGKFCIAYKDDELSIFINDKKIRPYEDVIALSKNVFVTGLRGSEIKVIGMDSLIQFGFVGDGDEYRYRFLNTNGDVIAGVDNILQFSDGHDLYLCSQEKLVGLVERQSGKPVACIRDVNEDLIYKLSTGYSISVTSNMSDLEYIVGCSEIESMFYNVTVDFKKGIVYMGRNKNAYDLRGDLVAKTILELIDKDNRRVG